MKFETIDDFIAQYGIKHTAIAKAMGVLYQSWNNHRQRRYKTLSIGNVEKLASFLRTPVHDVFELTYKAYITSVSKELPTFNVNNTVNSPIKMIKITEGK